MGRSVRGRRWSGWVLLAALALALGTPGGAGAQDAYKVKSLLKLGDPVGDLFVFRAGGFGVQALNDKGQILFLAENEAGGQILFQFGDSKFVPIVAGDRDAPGGKWPKAVRVLAPASMNAAGNVAFAADVSISGKVAVGTFLWDAAAGQAAAVALKGTPAGNQTLEQGGGAGAALNVRNEVAFVAQVKNAAGKAAEGVFLRGGDGAVRPVARPDDALPGGRKIIAALAPSVNDAGRVAFLAQRQGDSAESAYLWEQNAITPVAEVGADAPGGGKFTAITGVWVNNKNANVLFAARVKGTDEGLYLLADGRLSSVAVPGQDVAGTKLKTVQPSGVSLPNDLGQHAFLTVNEDKSTAAYLMDADGKLSLILKSGGTTGIGKVPNVGQGSGTSRGIALNSKGQIALTLRVGGGGGGGTGGGGDGEHGGGGGGGGDFLALLTAPAP